MEMMQIIKDLFFMPRSIMGESTRKTLGYIKKNVSKMIIMKFKTGKKVFDWVVPEEWNIKDAYIKEPNGKKVLDFKKNLLSIVYHSSPVKKWINKKELLKKYIAMKNYQMLLRM